jgi:hypothetical protein
LSSELSNAIHEFHQGDARDLWSTYQMPHHSMLVARAIALGLLSEDELPATLWDKLRESVVAFTEEAGRAV